MGAHRSEQLRMKKRHAQGAIASHGDTANAAGFAAGGNPVAMLDPGHKFLQEEVLVAEAPVVRVHEETGVTGWADQNEIADLPAVPEVLDKIESAGTHKHLLIITKPVEVIEHRIAAISVFAVARWQDHTVRNGASQDAAGHGNTFATGFSGWRWR